MWLFGNKSQQYLQPYDKMMSHKWQLDEKLKVCSRQGANLYPHQWRLHKIREGEYSYEKKNQPMFM